MNHITIQPSLVYLVRWYWLKHKYIPDWNTAVWSCIRSSDVCWGFFLLPETSFSVVLSFLHSKNLLVLTTLICSLDSEVSQVDPGMVWRGGILLDVFDWGFSVFVQGSFLPKGNISLRIPWLHELEHFIHCLWPCQHVSTGTSTLPPTAGVLSSPK